MNSQGAISALHGALEYIRDEKTNEWSVHAGIECDQQRFDDLRHYDGAILHLASGSTQNVFMPSNHPPVVLFDSSISKDDAERLVQEHSNLTVIVADFMAEGRCAAQHLIERRFKNFAYVGDWDDSKREADNRRMGFSDELQKNRLTCRTYRPPTPGKDSITFSDEVPHLEKWLLDLPLNTAIFVSGDARARDILALLIRNGVNVPEQMAVLGVGNDETLCSTSVPQLSSVDPNLHLLGCEAVKELDGLISGRGGVFSFIPQSATSSCAHPRPSKSLRIRLSARRLPGSKSMCQTSSTSPVSAKASIIPLNPSNGGFKKRWAILSEQKSN